MSWYEGVYEADPWGVFGGGTIHRDWYGFYPSNPTQQTGGNMNFLPGPGLGGGGGGNPGGGINITLPGGGGGAAGPSANQQMTAIVNRYEVLLQQNLGAWQGGQRAADAAIAEGWRLMNAMVSELLAYGAAGQRSAAERDRRIDPGQLRWDWIAYYIDPITGGPTPNPPALPTVPTNPTIPVIPTNPGGGLLPPAFGGMGNFLNDPLILAVLAILAIALVTRK